MGWSHTYAGWNHCHIWVGATAWILLHAVAVGQRVSARIRLVSAMGVFGSSRLMPAAARARSMPMLTSWKGMRHESCAESRRTDLTSSVYSWLSAISHRRDWTSSAARVNDEGLCAEV
jgi:hypothetical protein